MGMSRHTFYFGKQLQAWLRDTVSILVLISLPHQKHSFQAFLTEIEDSDQETEVEEEEEDGDDESCD